MCVSLGRQCMASCYFLMKQFEDVNIYLNSVKAYMYVCSFSMGKQETNYVLAYIGITTMTSTTTMASPWPPRGTTKPQKKRSYSYTMYALCNRA